MAQAFSNQNNKDWLTADPDLYDRKMARQREEHEAQRRYLEMHAMMGAAPSAYPFHPDQYKGVPAISRPQQYVAPEPQPTTKKVLLLCPSPSNH